MVLRRLLKKITGVSLFIKIMGISLFLILLFGMGVILQTKILFSRFFSVQLKERLLVTARYIESQVSEPLITGEVPELNELIKNTMLAHRDISYIVILDKNLRVMFSSLPKPISDEFIMANALKGNDHNIECFDSEMGRICDIILPVMKGEVGYLRIGMNTRLNEEYVSRIVGSLLIFLIIVAFCGIVISYVLAYILNRPIGNLVDAAERIRKGDYTHRVSPWFDDEIGKLTMTFNQMSDKLLEIQQLRNELIKKIIASQEEERLRISRELHDKTGQTLISLKLYASIIEKNITEEKTKKSFSQFIDTLNSAFEEIHNLSVELRNPVLNDFGVYDAIEEYLSRYDQHQIRFEVNIDDRLKGRRLPYEMEIQIFRVFQEAITNIIKHSGASRVEISLRDCSDTVEITIKDNGKGFDVEGLSSHKRGIGIYGMQERIALINGSFEISSRVNDGTIIKISVPFIERVGYEEEN